MRGRFITLEGGEGVGKSTQTQLLAHYVRANHIPCLLTREPGGSVGAEVLRDLLLSRQLDMLCPVAQTYLFSAARADHLERTIRPALEAGTWVICDRFADSTRVYQGVLGHVDPSFILQLEALTLGPTRPDLTFILDLPVQEARRRVETRQAQQENAPPLDRFEALDVTFHEALRQGFLRLAQQEPERCRLLSACDPPEEIFKKMRIEIGPFLRPA